MFRKNVLLLLPLILLSSCNETVSLSSLESTSSIEEREDFTITYIFKEETVRVDNVKKNQIYKINYLYETKDHQLYEEKWTNRDREFVVYDDMVFKSSGRRFLDITIVSDLYTKVDHMWRVPSDGVVVVLGEYAHNPTWLDSKVIRDSSDIKEVYLEKGIEYIGTGNFINCPNLKRIHYGGSPWDWEEITMLPTAIPESIEIIYNSPFEF